MANKDIMKEAKSVRRCAASVAIAKELDRTPPTISADMKRMQRIEAKTSLFRALNIHNISDYIPPISF